MQKGVNNLANVLQARSVEHVLDPLEECKANRLTDSLLITEEHKRKDLRHAVPSTSKSSLPQKENTAGMDRYLASTAAGMNRVC